MVCKEYESAKILTTLMPKGKGAGQQSMVTWEGKKETGPLRKSTIASKIEQGPRARAGQGQGRDKGRAETGAGRDTK